MDCTDQQAHNSPRTTGSEHDPTGQGLRAVGAGVVRAAAADVAAGLWQEVKRDEVIAQVRFTLPVATL